MTILIIHLKFEKSIFIQNNCIIYKHVLCSFVNTSCCTTMVQKLLPIFPWILRLKNVLLKCILMVLTSSTSRSTLLNIKFKIQPFNYSNIQFNIKIKNTPVVISRFCSFFVLSDFIFDSCRRKETEKKSLVYWQNSWCRSNQK